MSDKADALEAATKHKAKEFKRKKSGPKEQVAAFAENAEIFFTALASPSTNSYLVDTVPSAVLDTGAVGSIIGKEVLDRIMEQLALTTVRTVDDSSHRVHKFGTNGEPLTKTKLVRAAEHPSVVEGEGSSHCRWSGVFAALAPARSSAKGCRLPSNRGWRRSPA
jgi:hypothetical protein